MTETEAMRKYAEAHGFEEVIAKNATTYERPLPCVRDEHGSITTQSIRRLLQKINEELDELKAEIYRIGYENDYPVFFPRSGNAIRVADEAADTITAITTLCEAVGIDEEMRSEAQRRVNEKNRNRGRL